MKKIFGRKKLKKSKSDQHERIDENCINGTTTLATSGTFCRTTTGFKQSITTDECYSCYDATSSSVGEERHFDEELDKHMMQTIADVKYVKKMPKFVAVGEVNFQRECLDAHNAVRAQYGCQPLIWSQELCDLAHSWAVKLAERGRILFPELQGIGENIRLTIVEEQTHLPSGAEITEIWAREAKDFDFERPRWNPSYRKSQVLRILKISSWTKKTGQFYRKATNCGFTISRNAFKQGYLPLKVETQHFTQIVWKETSEMGIARQWNTTTNCVATVAMYRPSGNSNAPGEFQVNIPPKVHFDEIPVLPNTVMHGISCALRHSTTIQQESVLQNLPSSSDKS
uniref:SCP domain-containing protein n=1 Tax=Loa loa TaxID=7209 RepID=A0A1I7VUU0_LOALO